MDHRAVETLANGHMISLRTGCFCNPGAGEIAHGLTEDVLSAAFAVSERMSFEQFLEALKQESGQSAGGRPDIAGTGIDIRRCVRLHGVRTYVPEQGCARDALGLAFTALIGILSLCGPLTGTPPRCLRCRSA